MRKVFNFGKIDYNHSGRKNCMVEVEMELRDREGEYEFSVCGDIWNPRHTSAYCGGQCLDTIRKYINDPLFIEIYDLWKKWHLNTLHAGTEKQEAALDAWHQSQQTEDKIVFFNYKKDCDYLESIGLLFDEIDGKPYEYGHGWLTRKIPDDIKARMIELLSC